MLTVIRRVVVRTRSKRREAKDQGLAMSDHRSCFGSKRKERETACVPGGRPLTLALTLCSPGCLGSFGSPVP